MLDNFSFKKFFLKFTGKKEKKSETPEFSGFSAHLFHRVLSEDLEPYEKSVLDLSSAQALKTLSEYTKGTSVISINSAPTMVRNGCPLTVFTIVNDNMPFLFDSMLAEISDTGGYPLLALHPVLSVNFDKKGKIVSIEEDSNLESCLDRVSIIQIHLSKLTQDKADALRERLLNILSQIHLVVRDWQPMLIRLDQAISELRQRSISPSEEMTQEAIAFLEWLRNDNFIFFGMREFVYSQNRSRQTPLGRKGAGLGILSDPESVVFWRDVGSNEDKVKEIQALFRSSDPLIIGMTNVRSSIHRRVYMVHIALRVFDSKGAVVGQLHIAGLFTSTVSNCSVMKIPYLRSKASAVVAGLGLDLRDHSGKALINVLETYPRDELFQINIPMLRKHCEIILNLVDRPRVRALIRVDAFDRFVSVLVFVPRDRYDSSVRKRIAFYLQNILQGKISAFHPSFTEDSLARVHFIIGREGGKTPKVRSSEVESAICDIIRTWEDVLNEEASRSEGGVELSDIVLKFPDNYRNSFSPAAALIDARRIAVLTKENPIDLFYYRHLSQKAYEATLKIYHFASPVPLSSRVPILENMGFRVISEHTFEVMNENMEPVFIHEMALESNFNCPIILLEGNFLFEKTFLSVWNGLSENDNFNALAHTASLFPESVVVLRAFGRYLQQIGIPQSQDFIAAVLNRYPSITSNLYALFIARFDPYHFEKEKERVALITHLENSVQDALKDIANIDDDAIIRKYLNLIMSCVRTNYFSPFFKEGLCSFAIKFDPSRVHGLAEPRPWREIFVYGAKVEGVHLRFGPVSRGGIRWSDRAQDYRTEVLGLVKAQHIKNAVIVPVGAKGGFYPKGLPSSRELIFEAASNAYENFISSLLSLTDNLDKGNVVFPEGILCYDEADPYFVVAADKGTATFSDLANSISRERNFWLDDAFASGGSAGYDHKKMGITAKGAWEAVKRHFREMNKDIQSTSFTVCGVGDMSGDVFGNGMLLSDKISLVAAFDHRDIFIDPSPNESFSFEERKRLFCLPRSSWQDYDRSRLSSGGMIVSRSSKSVFLSPEAQHLLGLSEAEVSPSEVIKAILQVEVDLLWFGGIGTYVKGSQENNQEVGDHANDLIRINASELRAKVIGEGANLALTQRARIEFSLAGGFCNSDSIDNSAGVNSSDLEVNIKIALAQAMNEGSLSLCVRDKFLQQMTNQVEQLVLMNNYQQTLALSLAYRRGLAEINYQSRLIVSLEQRGLLNRSLETLPSTVEMRERKIRGEPLTRPEISILLAYSKIALFSDIVASDLPDDPCFEMDLIRYFPSHMEKKYSSSIYKHPLRREIIARTLANEIINRGGTSFVFALQEETGSSLSEIVRAFSVAREAFELSSLFAQIDLLDNKIDGKIQLDFYLCVRRFIQAATAWELKNGDPSLPLNVRIQDLKKVRKTLEPRLNRLLSEPAFKELEIRQEGFLTAGAPASLASRLALLGISQFVSDTAYIARCSGVKISKAANVFFRVTNSFRIDRIESSVRSLVPSDYYEEMALLRSLDMINQARQAIAVDVLRKCASVPNPLGSWMELGGDAFSRKFHRFRLLSEGGDMSMSRLMLVGAAMKDCIQEKEESKK